MDMRAAAAQVLAASVYDDDDAALLARRRRAAAALSAPLVSMADLLSDERDRPRCEGPIEAVQLRLWADEAVQLAREGRRSLLLSPDAALAAKALQSAAARADAQRKEQQREWLALVQLRQCRDIFELLRVLAAVDARAGQHPLDSVAVGPLACFFSPFETAGGLTAAGEGLLRALQLALKRLRATSGAAVCALEPDAEVEVDAPAQ